MVHRNASCSFCRKNYRDVGPLVEGPGDVFICGACIDLCQSIIDQEKRRRRSAGSVERSVLNQQTVATSCARELADLASALHAGQSCLVECDKDLALFLCADLRDRLRSTGLSCIFADGRPRQEELEWGDARVIPTMLAQLRKAVRQSVVGCVIVVPHLDVLAALVGGLSAEAREVITLLYEGLEQVWLAFRDPALPLLEVVEKRFPARYTVRRPREAGEALPPPERLDPLPGGG
jgi:hypothetical protein